MKRKKRKIINYLKNNSMKIIFSIMFFFLCFLTVGYASLNTLLSISRTATIVELCSSEITGTVKKSESNGDYLDTDGRYIYEFSIGITNNSEEPINNWYLDIQGPSDLVVHNIWNYNAEESSGGIIEITSGSSWNETLGPNQSFNIVVQLKSFEKNFELTNVGFTGCTIFGSGGPSMDTDVLTSLNIVEETASLSINSTQKLTLSKTPSYSTKKITWISSNESIAKVDENGVVTGISSGTVTITASSGELTDTCTVTVSDEVIQVESITINPSSYQMSVNETAQFQVEVVPSNVSEKITWTSDTPSVAIVDENGNVTAISEGTAKITASIGDKSASSSVTVVNQNTLQSLVLTSDKSSISVGETANLTVTKTPDNAETTLTFTSSNEDIAKVDSTGKVIGISNGTVTITVTGINDITATTTIKVTDPGSHENVDIVYTYNNHLNDGEGRQINQYIITITNNNDVPISNISFDLDVPEGTTIINWNATVSGNTLTYNQKIEPHKSFQLNGQITLPLGYDASTFDTITISNIKFE